MIRQTHEEHPELSIVELCEVLDVNRSWYYTRPTEPRVQEADLDVRDAVERLLVDFPGYGYRRVTAALRRAGWQINHKRVHRLMREESLLCQLKRHGCRRPPTRNTPIRPIPT